MAPLRNQAGSYAVEGSAQAAQAALPLLGRQLLEAQLDLNLGARGFHRFGAGSASRAAGGGIEYRGDCGHYPSARGDGKWKVGMTVCRSSLGVHYRLRDPTAFESTLE